ncbi:hypothetical protein GWK47_023800 [Chionoecetes opilio]|uniref:Uncharacterized protein n=1 Tax=Chionoecetes opilio TaxID=41210 RepID=A0A8J4XLI2_CHIOP|nr:hypothetical protein GWK47_023800 [Chionoecetes opilio]
MLNGLEQAVPPPQVLKHRAWKLTPHTATFPTSTCSLRCAATSDQLENVLHVGYTVLHISRDETLVSVISFPPVFHCSESWWIHTQGTVPVSDLVVCSTNVLLKRFLVVGANYTASVLLSICQSSVPIASVGSWSSKRVYQADPECSLCSQSVAEPQRLLLFSQFHKSQQLNHSQLEHEAPRARVRLLNVYERFPSRQCTTDP